MAHVFANPGMGMGEAPPRPALAFQVLMDLSAKHRGPVGVQFPGDSPVAVPDYKRDDAEERCYRAALRCLQLYFTGEMNYGDVEPNSTDKFLPKVDVAAMAEAMHGVELGPKTVKLMVRETEKVKERRRERKKEDDNGS